LSRWKKFCKQFNRNVRLLDTRKLFAIALICVAIDTGTAYLNFTLAPETFAHFEQNDLFRWALVTGHVEGYLVAEAIKIMSVVTVFALASWITVFRLSMLLFPMILLLAASTNLIAIMVLPTDVMFKFLEIVAVGLISMAFLNRRSLRWMKRR